MNLWLFFRHLIQLLLSPVRGWEDVSAASINPAELQRRGFYPWLGVTALSEFAPMIYGARGFWPSLEAAIAVACAMFASLYIGRLFMDASMRKFLGDSVNPTKIDIFVTFLVGVDCLFCIITNAMPASMTFLKLLPLLSVIIIFKSIAYMGVDEERQLNFTALASIGVIVIPLALAALILIILQ